MADDWFDWGFLDNTPVTGLGGDAATFNPDAAIAAPPASLADWFPQMDLSDSQWDWGGRGVTAPGGVDLSRIPAPVGTVPASPLPGLGGPGFNPNGAAVAALPLGFNPQTGEIVRLDTGEPVLNGVQVKALTQAVNAKDVGTIGRILEPVNKLLNTPLGGTLAALGLGGLGIGLSRAVAGDTGSFRPPARPTAVAMNPAAIALERDVRLRNLAGLRDLSPDASGSADPITVDLAGRLKKALAGDVSNPVLERANRDERQQLEARMLRKTGGSNLWDQTSAGLEATGRLAESQAIRKYLDNMQTIQQLEPRVASRQAAETQRLAELSGINTMDAQRNFENQLATKLAYDDYLTDRTAKADLAKGIAAIFGTAAGGLTGGARRPWERVALVS